MKVLVVYGGASTEREVSLVTGRAVTDALAARSHEAALFDPWSESSSGLDVARRFVEALEIERPDVVFVALHGGDGEDGTVQGLLDVCDVPYTGSGVAASAIGMDKALSKEIFHRVGVPTPAAIIVEPPFDEASTPRRAGALGTTLVTKPNHGGSTVGVSIVRRPEELQPALALAWRHDRRALVETFVPGRELTVGLIDGETLPVVEIVPESGFYDYEAKYTAGRSRYIVPADVGEKLAAAMTEQAHRAYTALGCRGVARVDFRLDPDRGPFCLEVNTVPGLTATSLVPKAAAAVGISFEDLCERICRSALERS